MAIYIDRLLALIDSGCFTLAGAYLVFTGGDIDTALLCFIAGAVNQRLARE